LLRAAAVSRCRASLVIAGDGPERTSLERLTRQLRIDDRVRFLGRASDETVVDYYNRCRAVFYGPFDEDFGLATVEAFTAGKPVITIADSGGVLELVRHNETGLVAESADPEPVAALLDCVLNDPSLAGSLGMAGKCLADKITWNGLVEQLLGAVNG
jgi:glycosyltransferase involved in cell wall biosynthesis